MEGWSSGGNTKQKVCSSLRRETLPSITGNRLSNITIDNWLKKNVLPFSLFFFFFAPLLLAFCPERVEGERGASGEVLVGKWQ